MQLPTAFDAESVALMSRVCYDAWWELKASNRYPSVAAEHAARGLLALRVMEAVGRGERDSARLRTIALECGSSPLETAGRVRQDEPRVNATAMSLS